MESMYSDRVSTAQLEEINIFVGNMRLPIGVTCVVFSYLTGKEVFYKVGCLSTLLREHIKTSLVLDQERLLQITFAKTRKEIFIDSLEYALDVSTQVDLLVSHLTEHEILFIGMVLKRNPEKVRRIQFDVQQFEEKIIYENSNACRYSHFRQNKTGEKLYSVDRELLRKMMNQSYKRVLAQHAIGIHLVTQ